MIACKGPTNTRVYTVAVYFRGQRLASADGPSIQAAEMNAAKYALQDNSHLFPHLQHQKRIMERSFMNQGIVMKKLVWEEEVRNKRRQMGLDEIHNECSKRNDEKIRKALEQKKSQEEEEMKEGQKPVNNRESVPENAKDIENDINDVDKHNVSKIEPEHEKPHEKDGRVTEVIRKTERPDHRDNLDSLKDRTANIPSSHQRKENKIEFHGNHTSSQFAFKNQYQYNNDKRSIHKLPASSQRSNEYSGKNRYSQDNDRYNATHDIHDTITSTNDVKQDMSSPNDSGIKSPGTTMGNKIEQNECNITETANLTIGLESNKLHSSYENKEEGELTDEDSETGSNKKNDAEFEDYVEPISSPE